MYMPPGPEPTTRRLKNVAAGAWIEGTNDSDSGSPERGRREGLRMAEEDLSRRTPTIRRLLETFGDLGPDGIGIDVATGLPLSNTFLECGTGVDFVAYDSEIDAYNERILAAYEQGALKDLTLGDKIRTRAAVQEAFATLTPKRLEHDGDTVRIGGLELVSHRESFRDGSSYQHLTIETAGEEARFLALFYPTPFHERPDTLWPTSARGPFDVLVVDDGTTAILRDSEGFAWILDLPRQIIVQVIGTRE